MAFPLLTTSDLPPTLPARVSFRQPVTSEPFVDGAWWPRSRDLAAELPALLDVLWTAAREVDRVLYSLASWSPAPRRLIVAGRQVRLGGFSYQDPALISMRDARGSDRIDILVIPPDAAPDLAAAAMAIAGHGGRNDRAARMLELAGERPAHL